MFEYHLDVKQARLTICISSWLLDTHFECLHFECILYGREIFMSDTWYLSYFGSYYFKVFTISCWWSLNENYRMDAVSFKSPLFIQITLSPLIKCVKFSTACFFEVGVSKPLWEVKEKMAILKKIVLVRIKIFSEPATMKVIYKICH